jgi:probable F420-dependent oxidoreductase
MLVGPYLRFRNPPAWRRDPGELYARNLDIAALIEELGYDSVWLTEHHFVDDGYTPSTMPIAAAIAARTRRVRIGTNVLLAPFHHPVRLAEDTAAVDLMSGGRLIVGVGSGYRPQEFTGYGIDRQHRGDLTDEVVEVLLRCWTEESVTHNGRFFQLRDVGMTPKPLQQPHPPLYLGGINERGLRRAARFSGGRVAGVATPELHQLLIREMTAAGRDPADIGYVHLLWVYVGEDDDAAWREAGVHAEYEHERYRRWWADVGREVMRAPTRDHYIVAGPETVLRRVTESLERAPGTIDHLVLGLDLAGLPPALLEASLRRFATTVLPRLR